MANSHVTLRTPGIQRNSLIDDLGSIKVGEVIKLVGGSLVGASLDTQLWTSNVANSGSISLGGGEARMRTNTTANGSSSLTSNQSCRLIAGGYNSFVGEVRLSDTGVSNNVKRWGAYSSTDGYFFILNGTTFSVGSRKASTDTLITSSSFNGGYAPAVDTNYHLYEIIYGPDGAVFLQDGLVLHKLSLTTGTLVTTHNYNLTAECVNSSGGISDCSIYASHLEIIRIGSASIKPKAFVINSAATTTLKSSPGTLVGVVIGQKGSSGATITIYDNTAGSGTVLSVIDAVNAGIGNINFNVDFFTGLTIVTSTTAGSYTFLVD